MVKFPYIFAALQWCRSSVAFSQNMLLAPLPSSSKFACCKKSYSSRNMLLVQVSKLRAHPTDKSEEISTITEEEKCKHAGEEKEEEYEFDSLDTMLTKARNRKMALLPYRVQAFTGKPIINLFNTSSLTIGECTLILVALKLGSIGFCGGYVVGKATTQYLRQSDAPVVLVELWTVLLAVGFDIVWNNLN